MVIIRFFQGLLNTAIMIAMVCLFFIYSKWLYQEGYRAHATPEEQNLAIRLVLNPLLLDTSQDKAAAEEPAKDVTPEPAKDDDGLPLDWILPIFNSFLNGEGES